MNNKNAPRRFLCVIIRVQTFPRACYSRIARGRGKIHGGKKEENEFILNWAINNLQLKILDIEVDFQKALPGFSEDLDVSINKSIRILPSKEMEGFFVAKLKKF